MVRHLPFTYVEPGLLPVLEELRQRELIFHTPAFGNTPAGFDALLAPDYWEVGASGRRYSREFVLRALEEKPPVDAAAMGWKCEDFGVRRMGPDTYLLTYTLHQGERITRRATVWQFGSGGWCALYHQGTIVSSEEDDVAPE